MSIAMIPGRQARQTSYVEAEFTPSLDRVLMRIYDHDDALRYEEMLIESGNEDDEENRGQYEFPEVEKALPEYIRGEETARVTDLYELEYNDPETLWLLILAIHAKDQSGCIQEYLSAGPVEDLLVKHGEKFIGQVESKARQDPTLQG